ncbi:hypothetical protein CPLU01_07525 [Colletotrichum plurivorum]|uniref:Uncharacterized protein n=1 Tax=Colletotrichum plurivorum TaxID=2175906 RepID=A0A8H6KEZ8_9PEZI|nr:hypothetical protein CPLU01_07525 [Colletotrichum plurivorum]
MKSPGAEQTTAAAAAAAETEAWLMGDVGVTQPGHCRVGGRGKLSYRLHYCVLCGVAYVVDGTETTQVASRWSKPWGNRLGLWRYGHPGKRCNNSHNSTTELGYTGMEFSAVVMDDGRQHSHGKDGVCVCGENMSNATDVFAAFTSETLGVEFTSEKV